MTALDLELRNDHEIVAPTAINVAISEADKTLWLFPGVVMAR
jgi:hypothetical protein